MKRKAPDRLMPVKEAAERLALSPFTVRAWVLERRIDFVRVGRKSIRIEESTIEDLVRRGRVPAARTAA